MTILFHFIQSQYFIFQSITTNLLELIQIHLARTTKCSRSNLKTPSKHHCRVNHFSTLICPNHLTNTVESILELGLSVLDPFTHNCGFPPSSKMRNFLKSMVYLEIMMYITNLVFRSLFQIYLGLPDYFVN